jgi:hypothetical protein
LPTIGSDAEPYQPWLAATADPWPGALSVWQAIGAETYRSVGTVTRPAKIGVVIAAPGAGLVSTIDMANSLVVWLPRAALSSVDRLALLNGSNLAAIGTNEHGFEIIQFETANLIDVDTFKLTGLIRGLRGTEDVMSEPLPADAWFILLDDALVRLPLERDQVGATLRYRVTPLGHDVGSSARTDVTHVAAARALRPLSPVWLTGARQGNGDITLSWVRRARFGGDSWAGEDVPLNEVTERYRVQILVGATLKRTLETSVPSLVYALADQIADHGSMPSSITVRVAQVASGFGVGLWRTATLEPPA